MMTNHKDLEGWIVSQIGSQDLQGYWDDKNLDGIETETEEVGGDEDLDEIEVETGEAGDE